jgi:hypothetical protein
MVGLEANDWQLLWTLATRGFNDVGQQLAEQVNSRVEAVQPPVMPPAGNSGEHKGAVQQE